MTIVFDLDGTVIDSSERMYRLFLKLVPECSFTKREYWDLKRNKVNHRAILEKQFPEYNFDEFNEQWMSQIEASPYLDMDTNYPDTIQVLEQLRLLGCGLVLLTARQSKTGLYQELERLGIKHFFDVIVVTEAKKSKEQLLQESIDDGTVSKNKDDLFISDMGKDIEVGKKLAYRTVGISHGFMSRRCLEAYNPDIMVKELIDILNYVK